MDAPALDALNLAERLRGESQEFWLHLETASPLEKYPAKQHARRVQEKLGVKHGLIYLPGAPARNNEDSDMPAPFRQRRYFYYLSGCNEPDCHLTYDIQRDTLTLFIPRVNPSRVIWNGRGSTPSEAFDKYDIDEVYFIDELQDFLQDWLKFCSGLLYILHNSQNPLIPNSYGRIDSRSLQPAMNLTRVVKDDHEIKLIQKANDISSRAHKEVLANILDFTNEAQVQGLFLNVCVSEQAKQQAYDPIAASGPNAGTLHYDANNEDFGDRQLMCLDAGCEYELYASDITRTFPLASKWPSKEAENIYNLVQRMQEECIERLAPGVRYLDLHILAHQIAIDGLLELGILHNGTREEIYKAGTSRAFFPHGLGHHVGLEVHDIGQSDLMSIVNPLYQKAPSLYPANYHVPVYDSKICQAPTDPQSGHLEEGMVVTVEPGIYFSAYALLHFYLPSPIHSRFINSEVVNRYMPVGGVRIEDDILITSRGYRNLTTAPKGQAMIDIIRNGKTHLSSLKHSSNRQSTVDAKPFELEETLIRAPGISRRTTQPRLKLVTKSATMPAVINPKRRSVDFEPFDGPSLFTNFKRSTTTTEENVQRWQEARRQSPEASLGTCLNSKQRNPICGDSSMKVRHAYIDLSSEDQDNLSPRSCSPFDTKAACKKCAILVQTLDRLRQNLTLSGQESSIQSQEQKRRVEPTATRKMLGTEQSRPLANTTSEKFGHCHGGSKLPRDAETSQLSPPLQSDSRRVSSMPPSEHELRAKTSAHFSRGIGEPTRRQSANSKPWHNRLLAIGDQGQASRQSLHFPRPSYDQGLPEGFDEERNLRFHSTQRQPHSRPSLPILPSEPSVPITTTLTPFLANKTSPSQHESNSPRRYHVTWPNAEEQMALKGLPHCFQPKHYMRAICRHLPNQTSCNRCVDGLENLGSEHGVKRPHAQLCEAGSAQLQRSFDKLSIHHEPEHKVANNNGLGR